MTNVRLILTYVIDRANDITYENIPNSTTVQFSQKTYTRPRLNSQTYKSTHVELNFILDSDKQELIFATQEDQEKLSTFASDCEIMKKSFTTFVESTDANWVINANTQDDKEDFLNGITDGKTLDKILQAFAEIRTAEGPKTPPTLPITVADKYSPVTGKHTREENQSPNPQSKRRLSL